MTIYEFTYRIETPEDELDVWVDRLYEAGGDDSSPGVRQGEVFVAFDRESTSLQLAIASARRTLLAAGLKPIDVTIDEAELLSWA